MHNRKLNVLDCMLEKMEQYSNNLEQVIAQRTTELMEEKEKTDQLLYRMLPRCVHAMRGAEGGGGLGGERLWLCSVCKHSTRTSGDRKFPTRVFENNRL